MKKLLATIIMLSVLTATCIVGGMSVSAAAAAEDFFVYDGVLVEYTGNGGDVVIPDNIGIKEIGDKAFYENTTVKSVVIPEGITAIRYKAFEGCTLLKTVDLPYSLTDLDSGAFRQCEMLEKVVIPAQVKKIGPDCFAGCYALSEVVISYGVQEIDVYAFSSTALTNIVIPETVKVISGKAFSNLTASRFTATVCNPTCDMGYYEITTGGKDKGFDSVFEGQSYIKTAITIRSTAGSLVEQYSKGDEYQPSYGKYMFQALTLEDIKALPENQKGYGKSAPSLSNDNQGEPNNNANNATDNKTANDSGMMMIIIIAGAVILLVVIIAVIVLLVMNNNKKQKMQMELLMAQLKQQNGNSETRDEK